MSDRENAQEVDNLEGENVAQGFKIQCRSFTLIIKARENVNSVSDNVRHGLWPKSITIQSVN
jgi:hypothetical protein